MDNIKRVSLLKLRHAIAFSEYNGWNLKNLAPLRKEVDDILAKAE